MSDHRQQALDHARKAVDLVNTEQRDWVEQGKVHAALAQAEASIYVGDQIQEANGLRRERDRAAWVDRP